MEENLPSEKEHSPSDINNFVMDRKEEQKIKCDQCGKEIVKKEFKKHVEFYHEGVRRHRCKICNKFYSSAGGLRTHISLVHEEQLTCLCPVCGKELKSKAYLKTHLRIHTGEKPYACENCPLRFSDPSSLSTHMKHKHREKVKGKMMICDICDQVFFKKFLLKKHIHDKHTLKDFSEERLKDFTEEAKGKIVELLEKTDIFVVAEQMQLPVRILMSWNSKRLCPVCGKNVYYRLLKTHIRRHEIENGNADVDNSGRSQCQICGKQLCDERALKAHMNAHQREKEKRAHVREVGEFAAANGYTEAGVKFDLDLNTVRRYYQLTFHPVQCELCEYQAPWQSYMTYHIRAVHQVTKNSKTQKMRPKEEEVNVDPRINQEILEKIESLQSEVTRQMAETNEIVEDLNDNGLEMSVNDEDKYDIQADPGKDDQENYDSNSNEEYDGEVEDSNEINVKDLEIEEDGQDKLANCEMDEDGLENKLMTDEIEKVLNPDEIETEEDLQDLKTDIKVEDEDEELSTEYENVLEEVKSLASEDLEIFKNILKTDAVEQKMDSEHENSPELDRKNKKSKKKKVATKPEIVLDLSKYGIDESSSEFVIRSDHVDDHQLMSALRTKKYKGKSRVFQCSICDVERRFPTRFTMRAHLESHSELKPYQCSHCPSKFKRAHTLSLHISARHDPEARLLICSVCGFETKNPGAFQRHHSLHDPSECSYCGKMYTNKQLFRRHVAVEHEGQSKYRHTCPVCGKKFIKTHQYNIHMKIHDGSLVISCETCGGNFETFETLKAHQRRMHEGIRIPKKVYRHSCTECGKTYSDKRELKIHTRMIHEGNKDKEFECSFCNKKFGRKASRDVHVLLHTGQFKKFVCEFCSASFKSKQNLMIHIGKHHPDQLRVEQKQN